MDFDWNNTDAKNSFLFHTEGLKQYLDSLFNTYLY